MTSKVQPEHFVVKWKIDNFGTFLLKIKIERNRKLDTFLFKWENNSKTFNEYILHIYDWNVMCFCYFENLTSSTGISQLLEIMIVALRFFHHWFSIKICYAVFSRGLFVGVVVLYHTSHNFIMVDTPCAFIKMLRIS